MRTNLISARDIKEETMQERVYKVEVKDELYDLMEIRIQDKEEIEMIRAKTFDPELKEKLLAKKSV